MVVAKFGAAISQGLDSWHLCLKAPVTMEIRLLAPCQPIIFHVIETFFLSIPLCPVPRQLRPVKWRHIIPSKVSENYARQQVLNYH
jgi:hypothetical protein